MLIVADAKIPLLKTTFGQLGEVITMDAKAIEPQGVKEAHILLVRSETRVDRKLLEGSRVQFVASPTIGTDHIDLDYLQKRGIGFSSAPGCNADSVAEYVVAALLRLASRDHFSLRGKMLGVVGVGNIGRRVVPAARLLGMEVLQNDPP